MNDIDIDEAASAAIATAGALARRIQVHCAKYSNPNAASANVIGAAAPIFLKSFLEDNTFRLSEKASITAEFIASLNDSIIRNYYDSGSEGATENLCRAIVNDVAHTLVAMKAVSEATPRKTLRR